MADDVKSYLENIKEYIADLAPGEELALGSTEPSLQGILLARGENVIKLGYLGTVFDLKIDDIARIEVPSSPIPNPYGRGVAVEIVLKPGALVSQTRSFRADLLQSIKPFALNQPSLSGNIPLASTFSDKEFRWRQERGLPLYPELLTNPTQFDATACGSYSPTFSGHNTTTNSNGFPDDNQNDGRGQDDSETVDQKLDD